MHRAGEISGSPPGPAHSGLVHTGFGAGNPNGLLHRQPALPPMRGCLSGVRSLPLVVVSHASQRRFMDRRLSWLSRSTGGARLSQSLVASIRNLTWLARSEARRLSIDRRLVALLSAHPLSVRGEARLSCAHPSRRRPLRVLPASLADAKAVPPHWSCLLRCPGVACDSLSSLSRGSPSAPLGRLWQLRAVRRPWRP